MAALKLSGAQVSTAPTASFPPTGMGMLRAPQWWIQMSLGDMMRERQAGAPGVLGDGSLPPSSLASIGPAWLMGELKRLSALLRLMTLAFPGPWERAKPALELTETHHTPRSAWRGGCLDGPQAHPGLGPPPNLKAQFAVL